MVKHTAQEAFYHSKSLKGKEVFKNETYLGILEDIVKGESVQTENYDEVVSFKLHFTDEPSKLVMSGEKLTFEDPAHPKETTKSPKPHELRRQKAIKPELYPESPTILSDMSGFINGKSSAIAKSHGGKKRKTSKRKTTKRKSRKSRR
jgi:hypothetical protein